MRRPSRASSIRRWDGQGLGASISQSIEPTYDFEVPGARSFIANGIAVHNSHAAAYGLVAYQTAYFKANYPGRVHGRAADLGNGRHRQDREVHRGVPGDGASASSRPT